MVSAVVGPGSRKVSRGKGCPCVQSLMWPLDRKTDHKMEGLRDGRAEEGDGEVWERLGGGNFRKKGWKRGGSAQGKRRLLGEGVRKEMWGRRKVHGHTGLQIKR